MLTITPLAAFADNYIWVITAQGHPDCLIVDPGEAPPVEHFLKENGLTLNGILITHHHRDHTGAIEPLTRDRAVPVYGPRSCPAVTHGVQDGDSLQAGSVMFRVLATPGHTLDHLAYFSQPQGVPPVLFCGDTLFSAGCGRLFEGTAEQMQQSLDKLASLPDNTRLYCAHEYTRANLDFALAVEPDNPSLTARLTEVIQLRQNNQPTLPSTLTLEKQTNPFLRTREQPVIQSASRQLPGLNPDNPGAVLGAIRRWKDRF